MTITTLSRQEFNRDADKAQKAARNGPVFITRNVADFRADGRSDDQSIGWVDLIEPRSGGSSL